jgi:hypothetical protein
MEEKGRERKKEEERGRKSKIDRDRRSEKGRRCLRIWVQER